MSSTVLIGALLAGLLGLGAWERDRRDRARAAIPIRVHVNGTRGKSTVTRLIAGALREAGIRTVAKTTGTAPRLILPDGSERPVRRRAPASIREQLWLLREAHRLDAGALIVECMAVHPDLQMVSEREMVAATIGVITNARLDHAEVMGSDEGDVARALAGTVPLGGAVVLGSDPGPWREVVAREAARRRAEVLTASDDEPAMDSLRLPPWQRPNYAVALAVTRRLGVPDDLALRGMVSAVPDPGSCTVRSVRVANRSLDVIDASAANDPASFRHLVGRLTERDLVVFNHRGDRPLRLRQFAESGLWADPRVAVLVTGDRPDWWSRTRACWTLGREHLPFVARPRLGAGLRLALGNSPDLRTVVLCGNTRGLDTAALTAALGE